MRRLAAGGGDALVRLWVNVALPKLAEVRGQQVDKAGAAGGFGKKSKGVCFPAAWARYAAEQLALRGRAR